MNVIDIGIVIILLFGALIGFKRGFTNELVRTLGFILVIILAFLLKNPLSTFLYEHLPFLNFGFLKGVAILNILFYEAFAFIIAFVALELILRLLIMATKIFEKVLTATIILGIPSKLLGAVVGVIYDYIVVFIILYIISIVGINASIVDQSKLRNKILNNTPILSNICNNSIKVIDEFKEIKTDYNNKSISDQDFNYKAMELFLKYKVISSESALKLISSGKIDYFESYQDLIEKYKEA